MYTLKIRWTIWEASKSEQPTLREESVMFIPAERITVHGSVETHPISEPPETMKSWAEHDYINYCDITYRDYGGTGEGDRHGGRLIDVVDAQGRYTWYLASAAWLIGPDGRTIERVAP